jgi:uncharacterized protein (TIGR00661 family)
MKILYGVVGEGMGHAMRSRVIIDELVKQHDVQVVVSGRAHDYLKMREGEHLRVTKIWGLTMIYEDNELMKLKTVLANVKGGFVKGGLPGNIKTYFELAEKFKPDLVVSDAESWSYVFGKNWRLPVISVDNLQMLNRCAHPADILAGHESDFQIAKGVIKAKLPGCYHYLITTFFYPPVRKKRTTLHPPVLRPEILAAKREPGEHLLVYQTSTSNQALMEMLGRCGRECRVYGVKREIKEDLVEGNVRYRPFSEKTFIDDLRTAKGVVMNGGFTLMGEAVYLHKPALATPVKGQFEQILNCRYLEKMGYGIYAEEVTQAHFDRFMAELPRMEQALAGYHQNGNVDIIAKLDDVLTRAAAGLPPEDAATMEEDPTIA